MMAVRAQVADTDLPIRRGACRGALSQLCHSLTSHSFTFPTFTFMSGRYAPIPNNRDDEDAEHELNAAFGDEDEEDDFHDATESQPLNPAGAAAQRSHRASPSVVTHGGYDFENVDYDYPPPGSPPPPSDTALPNNFGNSNGYIPSFNILPSASGPHQTWIRRTATRVLPARVADRWGLAPHQPDRAVGDGTNNDGVFANITAKPTRPVRVQQGAYSSLPTSLY